MTVSNGAWRGLSTSLVGAVTFWFDKGGCPIFYLKRGCDITEDMANGEGGGEVVKGIDQPEKKDPFRRLVIGRPEWRKDGAADFLIPTPENSKELGKLAATVVKEAEGLERKEFLRVVAQKVNETLPYAHTDDIAMPGTKAVSADLLRNFDNLVTAQRIGFATGAVCRHQAPVAFGLLRALEFDTELAKNNPLANEGDESRFAMLYFGLKDGTAHIVVYDWKDRLIIDPTRKDVFSLADLNQAWYGKIDPKMVKVVVLSGTGSTELVDIATFTADKKKYLT